VDRSRTLSCRLAPLATNDSGMPRASTRRLRLRPFFSPVRGVRPHAFQRQRCFSCRPIDALPTPGDALHLVVFGQAGSPNLQEKALPMPVLKVCMHGARAAILFGQRLPLAASTKHVDDCREDLPRGHRLAPCSRLALVVAPTRPFSRWDQRPNLVPQRIRHCPRLDLCHLGFNLRPALASADRRISTRNLLIHYLRISSQSCPDASCDSVGIFPQAVKLCPATKQVFETRSWNAPANRLALIHFKARGGIS